MTFSCEMKLVVFLQWALQHISVGSAAWRQTSKVKHIQENFEQEKSKWSWSKVDIQEILSFLGVHRLLTYRRGKILQVHTW